MTKRSIETRGVGQVRVAAGRLRLSLGVEARADGAARALQALWQHLSTLQRVLDDQGVVAADRQTGSLALNEAYERDGAPAGYQASCQVTATLADTDRAAACIDALIGGVGDAIRLHHTAWVVEPTPDAVAEARAAAVADAVDQARQLARAAGVALGPIRLVREVADGGDGGPGPFGRSGGLRAMAALPAMEAGESPVTVLVDVVHDIG